MSHISYRNKLLLKKLFRIFLCLLAIALVAGIILLIYAEPYVTYDRDGAHLRFSEPAATTPSAEDSAPRPTVSNPQIVYDDEAPTQSNIASMGGYYITTSMLQDPGAVLDAVKALEEPCAVMMEVKSVYGNFYYKTSIAGAPSADTDLDAVEELIDYLTSNHFYLIASVPAFSDPTFALENQTCGLPLENGALWMDENGCYWLDPANETVLSYLSQIARELSGKGFREIAFSGFRFPESSSIVYQSDQTYAQIIEAAATKLTGFFSGSNFMISFVTDALDFPARACQGRLYVPNIDGSQVERYAQAYRNATALQEIVFLASSRDVRFEQQAVLRPLLAEAGQS